MAAAIAKGALMVKAAGNSGRDGPFNADVATAAGAISLASVGGAVGEPVDQKVVVSRFSSIGPVSGGCALAAQGEQRAAAARVAVARSPPVHTPV